jgi:hypothetical protein
MITLHHQPKLTVGELCALVVIRLFLKWLKVGEMAGNSLLFWVSQIKGGERLNVVNLPAFSMVFPSHPRLKLGLKIFDKFWPIASKKLNCGFGFVAPECSTKPASQKRKELEIWLCFQSFGLRPSANLSPFFWIILSIQRGSCSTFFRVGQVVFFCERGPFGFILSIPSPEISPIFSGPVFELATFRAPFSPIKLGGEWFIAKLANLSVRHSINLSQVGA